PGDAPPPRSPPSPYTPLFRSAGFTVSLSNTGTGNAYDVTASDPLPGGTTWSISPASAGWSISGNVLTYGPATLAGGASTSVHVVASNSTRVSSSLDETASPTS